MYEERITWETHGRKRILINDYRDLSVGEILTMMAESEKIVKQTEGNLLLVEDVRGISVSNELVKHAEKAIIAQKPFIKKNALIGVKEQFKFMVKGLNAITGVNNKAFSTREEGIKWLLKEE